MSFLYEQIDSLKTLVPDLYREMPQYIINNLNPVFQLRPYQIEAFRNFITYFENDKIRRYPANVLFHMATGSGKTLIMAGLIIYLYKKGYRNFLFFVNLDTIVKKTKENFLSFSSSKYLFANDYINIDGENVRISEVSSFQCTNEDSINICFTTIQGLFMALNSSKENGLTYDDFENTRTVLIADEAHHLNVDTRRGTKQEKAEAYRHIHNWETCVNAVFNQNKENVLLEFTATCDLSNSEIFRAYESKIIFNYPLKQFREERYSKQVKAIRSDIDYSERALLALMFSQYRLKLFQDHKIYVKPIILFKSFTIKDSLAFKAKFHEMIRSLTGNVLSNIVSSSPLDEVKRMREYYLSKGITYDKLALEIQEEFSPVHCLSVNDDQDVEKLQLVLNSLESYSNPYRAIFEVKKLDEGWDVLNLFDIVRLYETRDSRNGVPGKHTISEAQLIGRGARYCPFVIDDEDDKYLRKYDNDIDNPLRACEELYYYCQYDSRYIVELNKALIATGILPENQTDVHYILKEDFKNGSLYKDGVVFANQRIVKSRNDVIELLPSIREMVYQYSSHSGRITIDIMLEESHSNSSVTPFRHPPISIKDISKYSYSIVHRAVRSIDIMKFNILKQYFPHLKSMREFITSSSYLGDIKIQIDSPSEEISPELYLAACKYVFSKIGNDISAMQETYEGSKEFTDRPFRDVFRNKTIHVTDPAGEGVGISQNSPSVRNEWQIDLSAEEWFVFNDNYGTTEEKAFVAYFASRVKDLQKEYENVYLVRNERQLAIYSFDGGERFEPDYIMILRKAKADGYEQYQIFVEPKGSHLLDTDKWKQDFLLQLQALGVPVKTLINDANYRIIGLPFFNREFGMNEFSKAFERVVSATCDEHSSH